jgi:hypothetical protein
MDPISNQHPPYSQYEIETFALQKPHRHMIQTEITLPKPFEVLAQESCKARKAKKNKKG